MVFASSKVSNEEFLQFKVDEARARALFNERLPKDKSGLPFSKRQIFWMVFEDMEHLGMGYFLLQTMMVSLVSLGLVMAVVFGLPGVVICFQASLGHDEWYLSPVLRSTTAAFISVEDSLEQPYVFLCICTLSISWMAHRFIVARLQARSIGIDMKTVTPRDYTVVLRNLPASSDKKAVYDLCSQYGEVAVIRLVYDVLSLIDARDRVEDALCEFKAAYKHVPPDAWGGVQGRATADKTPGVPPRVSAARTRLVEEMKGFEACLGKDHDFTGAAFVTFRQRSGSHACLKAMPPVNIYGMLLGFFKDKALVHRAPEPAEVQWKNLRLTYLRSHGRNKAALLSAMAVYALVLTAYGTVLFESSDSCSNVVSKLSDRGAFEDCTSSDSNAAGATIGYTLLLHVLVFVLKITMKLLANVASMPSITRQVQILLKWRSWAVTSVVLATLVIPTILWDFEHFFERFFVANGTTAFFSMATLMITSACEPLLVASVLLLIPTPVLLCLPARLIETLPASCHESVLQYYLAHAVDQPHLERMVMPRPFGWAQNCSSIVAMSIIVYVFGPMFPLFYLLFPVCMLVKTYSMRYELLFCADVSSMAVSIKFFEEVVEACWQCVFYGFPVVFGIVSESGATLFVFLCAVAACRVLLSGFGLQALVKALFSALCLPCDAAMGANKILLRIQKVHDASHEYTYEEACELPSMKAAGFYNSPYARASTTHIQPIVASAIESLEKADTRVKMIQPVRAIANLVTDMLSLQQTIPPPTVFAVTDASDSSVSIGRVRALKLIPQVLHAFQSPALALLSDPESAAVAHTDQLLLAESTSSLPTADYPPQPVVQPTEAHDSPPTAAPS
eukprot:Rmarinus@m.27617